MPHDLAIASPDRWASQIEPFSRVTRDGSHASLFDTLDKRGRAK